MVVHHRKPLTETTWICLPKKDNKEKRTEQQQKKYRKDLDHDVDHIHI